jgi:hypothetical protein
VDLPISSVCYWNKVPVRRVGKRVGKSALFVIGRKYRAGGFLSPVKINIIAGLKYFE